MSLATCGSIGRSRVRGRVTEQHPIELRSPLVPFDDLQPLSRPAKRRFDQIRDVHLPRLHRAGTIGAEQHALVKLHGETFPGPISNVIAVGGAAAPVDAKQAEANRIRIESAGNAPASHYEQDLLPTIRLDQGIQQFPAVLGAGRAWERELAANDGVGVDVRDPQLPRGGAEGKTAVHKRLDSFRVDGLCHARSIDPTSGNPTVGCTAATTVLFLHPSLGFFFAPAKIAT
jgi:hypothetical protein